MLLAGCSDRVCFFYKKSYVALRATAFLLMMSLVYGSKFGEYKTVSASRYGVVS